MNKNLKILLYGDVDLNIIDGSSVWVTSVANSLSFDRNINVDILLKAAIKRRMLIDSIPVKHNMNFIEGPEFCEAPINRNRLQSSEAVKCIKQLDQANNYDIIIVRGFDVVKELYNYDVFYKVVPYITNFEHDKNKISASEVKVLREIYTKSKKFFVQTNRMKEYLQDVLDVDGEKYAVLNPMIPDSEHRPSFYNKRSSLVYVGKFAKNWLVKENIDIFKELYEDNKAEFNIAGDKFHADVEDIKEEMLNDLTHHKGIAWKKALSRSESMALIKDSDIGVAFRSEVIDNFDNLELSTKILEFGINAKPFIIRRTKLHEEFLGEDYPLFAEDLDEVKRLTRELFINRELYFKASKRVYKVSKNYTFKETYNNLKDMLWSYSKSKKANIVFAGHDLKFLQMIIELFEQNDDYNVRIDKWDGHNSHDEKLSQECLEWADVIFCEWGLGNAKWYSNRKKESQKLVVRMHRQELDTDYHNDFNYDNIDKIIAISPYIYEEFSNKLGIDRCKMVIIHNHLDYYKLSSKNKMTESKFNIGIMGILPCMKRLDLAVDIIETLYKRDNRYKLFIKGKMPQDIPWLWKRQSERTYYEGLFNRIRTSPAKANIIFDEFSTDIENWFSKIGFMLSTSDFESFHLAPMEGLASGAYPIIRNWLGSDSIYQKDMIFEDTEEMANFILSPTYAVKDKKDFVMQFDYKKIYEETLKLIQKL